MNKPAKLGHNVVNAPHGAVRVRRVRPFTMVIASSAAVVLAVQFVAPDSAVGLLGVCQAYIAAVLCFALVDIVRSLRRARMTMADEAGAPVVSTSLDNPVLVIQGHAQVLQGTSVVFDTRASAPVTEEAVSLAAME